MQQQPKLNLVTFHHFRLLHGNKPAVIDPHVLSSEGHGDIINITPIVNMEFSQKVLTNPFTHLIVNVRLSD